MSGQTFAEWLRQKAKAAGYDVDAAKGARSKLAEDAGMSVTQVGRTLAGETMPSVESMRGLVHAFRQHKVPVSLDEMMVRSGIAEWDDFSTGGQQRSADLQDVAELLGVPEDRRESYVALMKAMAQVTTDGWAATFNIQLSDEDKRRYTTDDADPPPDAV